MILGKLRLVGLVGVASLAVACVVRSDPPPQPGPYPSSTGGTPSGGTSGASGSSGTSGSGPSGTSPILVDIDTDKTMNANPGDGVGVFLEYATGGHWHVWWTCDTNVNTAGPLTCDFTVQVNVTQGTITLKNDAPVGSSKLSSGGQQLQSSTTTGAEVHGYSFDTDPGAVITVDATIGGQRDGRYFFFVQNGQVNGGFTGTLTDPLMAEGSKP